MIRLLVEQKRIEPVIKEDPADPPFPLTDRKVRQMALAVFQRFALRSIFLEEEHFIQLRIPELKHLVRVLRQVLWQNFTPQQRRQLAPHLPPNCDVFHQPPGWVSKQEW